MTVREVGEILAWAAVLANLWWFHRRIRELEGKRTVRINRIEVLSDSLDMVKLIKGGRP